MEAREAASEIPLWPSFFRQLQQHGRANLYFHCKPMNDQPNTYLGVNLERWKLNMVERLRDERKRNVLLQKRLDDAQAMIARYQSSGIEPAPIRVAPPEPPRPLPPCPFDLNLRTNTEALIDEAMRRTGGNQTQAARLLGIYKSVISSHLRKRAKRMAESA